MSYLVLARKFRPQAFDDVIGQEHITTTLKNAILKDRVAHAYLFTGPRGIGKTSTARIFAKALNCVDGPTLTPCNQCPSCLDITKGNSMDVIEIDGASNRGIDEIRDLRENVKFAPTAGKFKIYIIDEVHMLTMEAFNALLKTLEEPPTHVKFIFATTAVYKVPATILSRCQRFDFKKISVSNIVKRLEDIAKQQSWQIDTKALYAIAETADGSMRDSQSLLDQIANFCGDKISYDEVKNVLGLVGDEVFFDVSDLVKKNDAPGLVEIINNMIENGVEPLHFINGMADFFRNMLISVIGGRALATIQKPAEYVEKLARTGREFSEQDILYILNLIMQTRNTLRRSDSGRLLLEMLMVKITLKEDLSSLDKIISDINVLEDKIKKKIPYTSTPALDNVSVPANKPAPRIQKFPKEEELEPETAVIPRDTARPQTMPPGDISDLWQEIVETVKNKKPSCGACLQDAEVLEVSDTNVKLGFSEENKFHLEVLKMSLNKELVEACILQLTGKNVRICFELIKSSGPLKPKEPTPQESAKNEAHRVLHSPVVNKIISEFDAQIVKVEKEI